MHISIGSPGGLRRASAIRIGWGMVLLSLGLAAYELFNPGALLAFGRNIPVFSWARESLGLRGVAWVHLTFAGIATLCLLALQSPADDKDLAD